ncbi:unnamed protein product [Echinostoma caproni]|uniref:Uncharacterized protein n=1 Tax=Echinostoma caproni TaxID=27848 RepID=A0A183AA23_9TREM|nr:unnamed protein product [Echinostoma caproni]
MARSYLTLTILIAVLVINMFSLNEPKQTVNENREPTNANVVNQNDMVKNGSPGEEITHRTESSVDVEFYIWDRDEDVNKQAEYAASEDQTIRLGYRIQINGFRCFTAVRIKCHANEGVRLENMKVTAVGPGTNSSSGADNNSLSAQNEFERCVDLGDLCATGNADSWISEIALCNRTFNEIRFGDNCLVELNEVKSISQFDDTGRNKLQITPNKTDEKNSQHDGTGNQSNITISVRMSDAEKEQNNTYFNLTFRVEDKLCGENLEFEIEAQAEYEAVLNIKTQAKKSDVYPRDNVTFVLRVAQNQDSQLECKAVRVTLHHSEWIKSVKISNSSNQLLLNITQSHRLTEIVIGKMHFSDEWQIMANEEFMDRFTLSNGDHVKTLPMKMQVVCVVYNHIPLVKDALFNATINITLYINKG